MTFSLNDLIGSTVEAGDRRCTLREAFFHMDDGKLRYVALDIGGWLNVDEVLVQAGYLLPPETEGAAWRVALDEDALEQAPGWNDDNRQDMADMTSWPPVIVGPFGNAFSPMLVHEQMRDIERGGTDDAADRRKADGLVMRLQRAGTWIGLPVFGPQGEIGKILDLLVDTETLEIRSLLVGESGLFSTTAEGRVPFEAIRHMADQGTHLVVDTDAPAGPASAHP